MATDLVALLRFAKEQGASDLHLSSGMPPILRIHGEMVRVKADPLTREDALQAVRSIMTEGQRKAFEERLDIDFAVDVPEVARFRANAFQQHRGAGGVFRVVPNKVITLEQLGMPKVVRDLAQKEKGLVLVTGPTGSGKSTTLAAMVDFINETESLHILTIEDPIEFLHESKRSLVNQREVGPHTTSFSAALRAALREDPDVILVGELRDLETTQLAISAAETGHLVLGTLHTNSAAKTIDRLVDIFPPEQQQQIRTMLSESIEGIVTQSLLPAKDGNGRVAALEVLIGVPALRNLIRENKTAQIMSVIQTGAQHGMQSIDQALRDLVMQGKVSREEAMKKSSNPSQFDAAGAGGPATPAARPGAPARPGMPARG
jgi:twitching motility protein PilT